MPKLSRRRNRICAYCGETKPISRDHVIPRCMFPRPLPAQMLTVPSCDDCNGLKSKHDDFLRDLLVTDFAGSDSEIARQLFNEKTIRSHQQNKSLFGRITQGKEIYIPIRDADGRPDTAVYFSFDENRAIEMFSFIIRGLYYAFNSLILPQNCEFKFGRLMKDDLDGWIDFFNEHGANVRRIGDGEVFSCAYNYGESEPNATFWLLEFFGRVHYSAMSLPVGHSKPDSNGA